MFILLFIAFSALYRSNTFNIKLFVPLFLCIGAIAGAISYQKILYYTDDDSIRATFYVVATMLALKYSPLGAGWCNIEGGFAANTLGTVSAELSDQPQVLSLAIRLTPEIQAKGGVWFYPNIFIARPGGEAVVEKAELKVRRIW